MIHRLHFSIEIKAERNTIWNVLWEDASYRKWASVFFEGSYMVADNWKEGNKVLFLGPDQSGIYSIIEKHIPNEIIGFKHIGNVINGEEQDLDDETKKWSGAKEVYSLTEGSIGTILSVEIDIMDEHLDFMREKLPQALDLIAENC